VGLGLALGLTGHVNALKMICRPGARRGRANCRCHADPPVRHGPYWQWTRKVADKTITRLVPEEQLVFYRQWLDNDPKLRALVAELEALPLAIADDEPRGKRRPAGSARNTWQTTT
jgi:hypothetical protein